MIIESFDLENTYQMYTNMCTHFILEDIKICMCHSEITVRNDDDCLYPLITLMWISSALKRFSCNVLLAEPVMKNYVYCDTTATLIKICKKYSNGNISLVELHERWKDQVITLSIRQQHLKKIIKSSYEVNRSCVFHK